MVDLVCLISSTVFSCLCVFGLHDSLYGKKNEEEKLNENNRGPSTDYAVEENKGSEDPPNQQRENHPGKYGHDPAPTARFIVNSGALWRHVQQT